MSVVLICVPMLFGPVMIHVHNEISPRSHVHGMSFGSVFLWTVPLLSFLEKVIIWGVSHVPSIEVHVRRVSLAETVSWVCTHPTRRSVAPFMFYHERSRHTCIASVVYV